MGHQDCKLQNLYVAFLLPLPSRVSARCAQKKRNYYASQGANFNNARHPEQNTFPAGSAADRTPCSASAARASRRASTTSPARCAAVRRSGSAVRTEATSASPRALSFCTYGDTERCARCSSQAPCQSVPLRLAVKKSCRKDPSRYLDRDTVTSSCVVYSLALELGGATLGGSRRAPRPRTSWSRAFPAPP